MANEININTNRPQIQSSAFEQAAKLSGDSTKAKEIVSKALEILAGANVRVTRSDDTSASGVGERKTTGATNVPSLDNPGDAKQMQANLEKLVAYLQLDNEERQTQMAKDRIEIQKDNLETEHKDRMKELEASFKKMFSAFSTPPYRLRREVEALQPMWMRSASLYWPPKMFSVASLARLSVFCPSALPLSQPMRVPGSVPVSVWLYVPPYMLNVACGGLIPVLL